VAGIDWNVSFFAASQFAYNALKITIASPADADSWVFALHVPTGTSCTSRRIWRESAAFARSAAQKS
jgi:hypothetical protein